MKSRIAEILLSSLSSLGALHKTQGQYIKAEPLCKSALAIGEKALGPDHLDVATSLNNLAVLYANQGRYMQAELYCGRSLKIMEKSPGLHHPDVPIG